MNWTFEKLTMAARGLEVFRDKNKDQFRRITQILGGKQMGAASLSKQNYTKDAIERMREKLREHQNNITSADFLINEIRSEQIRLSEGGSVGNGHAAAQPQMGE